MTDVGTLVGTAIGAAAAITGGVVPALLGERANRRKERRALYAKCSTDAIRRLLQLKDWENTVYDPEHQMDVPMHTTGGTVMDIDALTSMSSDLKFIGRPMIEKVWDQYLESIWAWQFDWGVNNVRSAKIDDALRLAIKNLLKELRKEMIEPGPVIHTKLTTILSWANLGTMTLNDPLNSPTSMTNLPDRPLKDEKKWCVNEGHGEYSSAHCPKCPPVEENK